MKKIKELFFKYKELIVYVFFGGLTTLVNLVAFRVLSLIFGYDLYLVSNAIAWFICVIFAYITNKIWVFEVKDWSTPTLLKEIPAFFAARVFSFILEEIGLFVLVDLLKFNEFTLDLVVIDFSGEMVAKLILGVLVVIINYVFSKLVIFKKK